MHDVPQGADLPVSDRAEHAGRVGSGAVRVVRLQEDAHAEVRGVLGGGAQAPGGRGVGLGAALLRSAAREDAYVGRSDVAGEFEE